MNSLGTFIVSVSADDPQKVASWDHSSFLTSARVSEKVGCSLSYHAALRTTTSPFFLAVYWWAKSVTTENTPSNEGRFSGSPNPTNASASQTQGADVLLEKW